MKSISLRRKIAGSLVLVGTLACFSSAVRAADSDISSKIYGSGKATLRWPNDENRSVSAQPEYYNGERLSYFEGTVSRVLARDYFELRSSDGHNYRVIWYEDGSTFNLSPGARVEVSGQLSHDLIIAHRYRDIGYGYGNRQVDFPATVNSVSGYSRVTVRAENGRTYTIDTRGRLPYNLSTGDYVRVIGTWNGSTVSADQIVILRDGYSGGYGGGYNGGSGSQVDFPGIVTNVDRYRNTLNVRGENGVTYSVSYDGANRLGLGERVRVVGYFDGYTVRATSVSQRY